MRNRAEPGHPPDDYRAVFEAAPDGIIIVDQGGTIRDANPAALRMFAYAVDELVGAPIEILVPDEARARHETHRRAFSQVPRTRPMGIGMELRGRRRDGSLFPVEIGLSRLESRAGTRIIAIIRDFTPRLRLRRFGAEALRAMEEERQRIALELHDDTAQRLSALLVMLRTAMASDVDEGRQEMLGNVREGLVGAAEAVRRIARGLRPPALDDVGLPAALRRYLRELEPAWDATVTLDLEDVDALLEAGERLAIYRIVQEALSNIARHAGASGVTISLRRVGDVVRVVVSDDGRGFDPELMDEDRGLGLLGMQERARMIGADVTVESRIDAGTTIRLDVPIRDGASRDG